MAHVEWLLRKCAMDTTALKKQAEARDALVQQGSMNT